MVSLTAKAVENLDAQFTVYKMQMNHLMTTFKTVLDMVEVGMDLDPGTKENLTKD